MDSPKPEPVDPEQWVDLYGDYLFRYALMRLRDHEAARDAVQETFLAGIKSLDRFDGRVAFKFWLRGILKFKIVDAIRKSVRDQVIVDWKAEKRQEEALTLANSLVRASPASRICSLRRALGR